MKQTIVVASSNVHKVKEIKEILSNYDILTMADVGFDAHIEENGKDFLENSLIKAKAIRRYLNSKKLDYLVLADDSGLCCNALNGEPGVYSARYAQDESNAENNRQKLLCNLSKKADRTAYFVCNIVLLDKDYNYCVGVGKTYGSIATEYAGDTSFGYDCIFYSDDLGKTFGSATDDEKNNVSHRGRALQDLMHNVQMNAWQKLKLTDIEIAHSVTPKPIVNVAKKLNLTKDDLLSFGDNIAKIKSKYVEDAQSKLVLVTSINPTSAGNGKTTVSIGLADAINKLKKSACLALREPSMGPVFGIKGGATGGGYSQVIPMEDINLHFTGDFHAITSANNLLCSAIDNHIFQGNELQIDVNNILFNRCLDLNDRALRNVEVEIDKDIKRADKFNITAASEVMAIMCVSKDLQDLKARLGNIMVALNVKGKPIYARDLHVEEAMTILLKDALKPNLVQTLSGGPAIVHCGPFANIAHGCNSIIATNTAMQHSEYTITEAGFGADLGAEKFLDFKCRVAGLKPNCVVIVATIPALKLHGGVSNKDLKKENVKAVKLGFANLKKHIDNMKNIYHVPCVVTLNKFATDTVAEIDMVSSLVARTNTPFAINNVWAYGGDGAIDLAKLVIEECDKDYDLTFAYELEESLKSKIAKVTKNVYGAKKVNYSDRALEDIKKIKKLGLENLPIIVAKTQYSLSDNKDLLGAPKGFEVTVRGLEIRSGAGFIVVLLGKMLLMPGLNKAPAYLGMSINDNEEIVGIF